MLVTRVGHIELRVPQDRQNIQETLSFHRLPRQHHKNLKSTNMLERSMEEIKRRTLVVRIFPNAAACLRLVRALAVETHEN
jgi:putative transposase